LMVLLATNALMTALENRSPVVEASRSGGAAWPIRPEPAGCVGTLG
jgi:hypothetical protein